MLCLIEDCRHPCNNKPSVVADIGLRLQEGIQDLKIEQQLAPAREAAARAINVGSTNFFKAVEGVRGRWAQRTTSSSLSNESVNSGSSTPVEVTKADVEGADAPRTFPRFSMPQSLSVDTSPTGTSPAPSSATTPLVSSVKPTLSAWGAGIGSFLSTRAPRFSMARAKSDDGSPSVGGFFSPSTPSSALPATEHGTRRMSDKLDQIDAVDLPYEPRRKPSVKIEPTGYAV